MTSPSLPAVDAAEPSLPASEAARAAAIAALRSLDGVIVAGDRGYDEARLAWNLAADQRPLAVAEPTTLAEIQRVVRAAVAAGIRVAPQSTGHNALPLVQAGLDDALLLRLHRLREVRIDADRPTALVSAGSLWRDAVEAAAPHGLTALHGSAGDVGAVGYTLGGGLSFYGRRYGLAAHHVRAFEVVTASGDVVRSTPFEHAGLFWALRGGGGGLGIVVSMEIELLPLSDVQAGFLLWDISAAPAVLPAWRAWTTGLDRAATTSLRMLRFPPLPELPPFLSGRSLIVVDGAVLADDERTAELLAPLRALRPEMDTFARIPASAVLDVHMDPPAPSAGVSEHGMMRALDDETVETLLAIAGPGAADAPSIVELRHLGGALSDPIDAALPRLDGEYALLALEMVPVPEVAEVASARVRATVDAVRDRLDGAPYLNFIEDEAELSAVLGREGTERLRRVRALYDPMHLWVAAHRMPESVVAAGLDGRP
ncbi:MAG: FAD-binding oxidoreductase [Microbacterium sp.]|nr:FAD-binding oxidoreductase [Microbacterium sp.]